MKAVFVDTNIIVDLIADRKPFSKYAIALFKHAEEEKINLYTSSHSIATTHYLLKKYLGEKDLRNTIFSLLDYLRVIAVDEAVLRKGLRSKHTDFEDAIQIVCATTVEIINCIVTRNIKDFKDCEILVLSPDELIVKLKLAEF